MWRILDEAGADTCRWTASLISSFYALAARIVRARSDPPSRIGQRLQGALFLAQTAKGAVLIWARKIQWRITHRIIPASQLSSVHTLHSSHAVDSRPYEHVSCSSNKIESPHLSTSCSALTKMSSDRYFLAV